MNTANKLTISRIVMAIFILIFLLIPWNQFGITFPTFLAMGKILVDSRYIAVGIIFIFACITDYLDGMIARRENITSSTGACLDAIADKLLVNGLLVILAYQGFISIVIPIIIISRDIIVDALKTLSAYNGIMVKANKWGKIKTIFMMVGLTLMLFYNLPFESWNFPLDDLLVYLATILSVASAAVYYFEITNKNIKKTNK